MHAGFQLADGILVVSTDGKITSCKSEVCGDVAFNFRIRRLGRKETEKERKKEKKLIRVFLPLTWIVLTKLQNPNDFLDRVRSCMATLSATKLRDILPFKR